MLSSSISSALAESRLTPIPAAERTVTTKHVMLAIKAVELWFTDRPSGCHGLLSRMCTALHINNVLLHEMHGGGNTLPVAAINRLSTAANKHKRTAKNDQNRKAAMRGLSMEAAICEPNNAQRICQQMVAYVETSWWGANHPRHDGLGRGTPVLELV